MFWVLVILTSQKADVTSFTPKASGPFIHQTHIFITFVCNKGSLPDRIFQATVQGVFVFISLTQINRAASDPANNASNSLNLKPENLQEQKADRVNATVCF